MKDRLRDSGPLLQEGFEKKVWEEIGRRKVRRKVVRTTVLSLFFVAVVLIVLFGLPGKETSKVQASKPADSVVKEEVPLVEEVYAASYDENTDYLLEDVSESPSKKATL